MDAECEILGMQKNQCSAELGNGNWELLTFVFAYFQKCHKFKASLGHISLFIVNLTA